MSTPSAIEAPDDSGNPRYDSHESFGFRPERRKSHSATVPPLPTATWPQDEGGESSAQMLPANENLFISDLAIQDDANVVDVDAPEFYYGAHDDSMDQRANNTSAIMERVASQAISQGKGRKYTEEPPPGHHRDYIKHTGFLESPNERFTQVLIWNLTRRIRYLEPKAMQTNASSAHTAMRLMENLRDQLENKAIELKWSQRDLLDLKPRVKRELNTYNRESQLRLAERRAAYELQNAEAYSTEARLAKQIVGAEASEASTEQRDDVYSDVFRDSVRLSEAALRGVLAQAVVTDGEIMQKADELSERLERRTR